ncbi:hypothetical protein HID58_071942 [Brassica napus]|uniref:ACT domain-containing protein ACR n=1 Tax=Brassica napus TaxID=3708 RepID=A0ABQ7Z307_BRANA|nr:hypothetical protein HID58_071942 [Brassica napus]
MIPPLCKMKGRDQMFVVYKHCVVVDDDSSSVQDERQRPDVCVDNWLDKDYSVFTVRCKDRPKLLFDTVCTLTDMQYVVFHGSVDTEGTEAYQEYYVRHIDGSPVKSETAKQNLLFLVTVTEDEFLLLLIGIEVGTVH